MITIIEYNFYFLLSRRVFDIINKDEFLLI